DRECAKDRRETTHHAFPPASLRTPNVRGQEHLNPSPRRSPAPARKAAEPMPTRPLRARFVNTRGPRQRDNSTDRPPASRTVTNPGMTLAKPMWGSRRDGGAASIG